MGFSRVRGVRAEGIKIRKLYIFDLIHTNTHTHTRAPLMRRALYNVMFFYRESIGTRFGVASEMTCGA